MRAAARCFEPFVVWLQGRHSEVYDFDVLIAVQENIFGLEVSMANVKLVAVSKCSNDLTKQPHCFVFWEAAMRRDMIEELPTFHVLQNKVSGTGN